MRKGQEKKLFCTGVKDEKGNDIFIRYDEIEKYLTDEFFECLEIFYLTENLGVPPFSEGWTEWPEQVVIALNTLKVEKALYDQKEMQEMKDKHK